MESALVRHAEILFGESVIRRPEPLAWNGETDPSLDDSFCAGAASGQAAAGSITETARGLGRLHLTARQRRRLWRHVESVDGFWEKLKEVESGAIQRLAAIAADRRWEVIFLTRRPETRGATAQVQTQRWLEACGFTLPSVYVVQGSRGRIADALGIDVIVDDRPENCVDVVVDSRARAILLWRDDDKLLPIAAKRLGIGVVKSIGECLDSLSQDDHVEREQPRVVNRVQERFAFNELAVV